MTSPLTFINGEPGNCLSSHDRGLAYGHGVFETMRLQQGLIPLRQLHMDRLARGLHSLAIGLASDVIDRHLDALLLQMPRDGVVKLLVTAGCGPRGYRASPELHPVIVAHWYPAPQIPANLSLQVCRYRLPTNPVLAGIKHLNRLDQVLAASELTDKHQGLLLDQQDRVVEALSHNFFVRMDGSWQTPPLDLCGVAGVMRRYVMESLMPDLGLAVAEQPLPLAKLSQVEELFVCNAVVGIVPVSEVEAIGRWPLQPNVDRLRRALIEKLPCYAP